MQDSVYKAVPISTGANVAVKHVIMSNDDARKYYTRELAALRALSHPACQSYIASKERDSEAILVTRLEPHGTLEATLKCEFGGVTPQCWITKKTIIVFGIAFAMEHIHKKGFAHRDLKPGNVFLDENYEPVIGDFGAATDFRGGQSAEGAGPTMYIGTPLHMAPEAWVDDSDGYDQGVDVYGYAVLLYCLFAPDPCAMLDDGKGKVRNISDLMKRIRAGARFRRLPQITPTYWELITNGWEKVPSRRPIFTEIVNAMIVNVPAFLFEGADEAAVRQYVAKMIPLR
jgi:serine/threonine protein kinase